jgi:hypothetical protein
VKKSQIQPRLKDVETARVETVCRSVTSNRSSVLRCSASSSRSGKVLFSSRQREALRQSLAANRGRGDTGSAQIQREREKTLVGDDFDDIKQQT